MPRLFCRSHILFCRKVISLCLVLSFGLLTIVPPSSGQVLANIPLPGQGFGLTVAFLPPVLRGMTVHPENPLLFDFIVDRGQDKINNDLLKVESTRLIKYFLASMTIPDKDAWVNLSPTEKDRIIPDALGQTEMGRQMLEQDYVLKQMAASLTNPDTELGRKYWDEVHRLEALDAGRWTVDVGKNKIQSTTTVQPPATAFNKVWIVPAGATVVEKDGFAYITQSRLNVMLDEEYTVIASPAGARQSQLGRTPSTESQTLDAGRWTLEKNNITNHQLPATNDRERFNIVADAPISARQPVGCNVLNVRGSAEPIRGEADQPLTPRISTQVFRDLILPKLIEEVNTGKSFAATRQVYQSVILAAWYKKALKDSLLGRIYADKSKVAGVETDIKDIKEKVYEQYLEAFKKGAYNVIKEELDSNGDLIPRKYFSGGLKLGMNLNPDQLTVDRSSSAVNRVAVEINRAPADQLALVAASGVETPGEANALVAASGIEKTPEAAMVDLLEELLSDQFSEIVAAGHANKFDGEIDDELDHIFRQYSSRAYEIISESGVPFYIVATELLKNHTFIKEDLDGRCLSCEQTAMKFFSPLVSANYEMIAALKILLEFAYQSTTQSQAFLLKISQIKANIDFEEIKARTFLEEEKNFPDNPLPGTVYLDLASGPHFARYMPGFDSSTHYVAVDNSPFVVEYLREVQRLLGGAANVDILQADLMRLERPSLPVGVIRVKNVWRYVDEFAAKLREMSQWIAPKGQLLIQTDPDMVQRKSAIQFLGDLPEQLISEGWKFEYEFGDERSARMDRLIFTKGDSSDSQLPQLQWSDYVKDFTSKIMQDAPQASSSTMDNSASSGVDYGQLPSDLRATTWTMDVRGFTGFSRAEGYGYYGFGSGLSESSLYYVQDSFPSAVSVDAVESQLKILRILNFEQGLQGLVPEIVEQGNIRKPMRVRMDLKDLGYDIQDFLKNDYQTTKQHIVSLGKWMAGVPRRAKTFWDEFTLDTVSRFYNADYWYQQLAQAYEPLTLRGLLANTISIKDSLQKLKDGDVFPYAKMKVFPNAQVMSNSRLWDSLNIDEQFDVLVELAETFYKIHQAGVVVKGISPRFVAVGLQNGKVAAMPIDFSQSYLYGNEARFNPWLIDKPFKLDIMDFAGLVNRMLIKAHHPVDWQYHLPAKDQIELFVDDIIAGRKIPGDMKEFAQRMRAIKETSSRIHEEYRTLEEQASKDPDAAAASSGVDQLDNPARRNFLKSLGAAALLPFLPHGDANAADFSLTENAHIVVISKGQDTFESIVQQLTSKAVLDQLDPIKKRDILEIAFEKFKQENPHIKFDDIDKPFAPETKFLSRDTHEYLAFAIYMALSDVVAQQTVWVSGQNVPVYYVQSKIDVVYASLGNAFDKYGIIININQLNASIVKKRKDFLKSLAKKDAPAHYLNQVFEGKSDREFLQDIVADALTHEIAHVAMFRDFDSPVQSDESWVAELLAKQGPVARHEVWAYLIQIAIGKMPRVTMNILQFYNDKKFFGIPTGPASRIVIWSILDELGFGDYWAEEEIKAQQANGEDFSWFKKAAYRFVISRYWSKKEYPFLVEYQAAKMDQFLATKTTEQINAAATRVFERLSGRNIPWISEDLKAPEQVVDLLLAASSSATAESVPVASAAAVQNTFTKGGIDFDPSKLNLQIKRDGHGVPLPLLQQDIENININGLYPVILNILPVNTQTLPILGQLNVQPEAVLSLR